MTAPIHEESSPPALAYATPGATRGPRVWACLILIIGALGLVFLGGCFMIGIMAINEQASAFHGGASPSPKPPAKSSWSASST